MSNLVFEALSSLRLLVSYQTTYSPSDPEWDAWIDAAQALHAAYALPANGNAIRLLVASEGGHPNGSQIERLRARKRSNPLTSIVSPSVTLRFVASAMTFLNPAIRCFTPTQLDRAYAHLGLTPVDGRFADAALSRLRAQAADGGDDL